MDDQNSLAGVGRLDVDFDNVWVPEVDIEITQGDLDLIVRPAPVVKPGRLKGWRRARDDRPQHRRLPVDDGDDNAMSVGIA